MQDIDEKSKKRLDMCIDWAMISKEVSMKGIEQSYYYEEPDDYKG